MVEITKELLDIRVCDYSKIAPYTYTLREFITNSEKQFKLTPKDVENMNNEDFNKYLEYLDELWDIHEGIYAEE